MSDRTPTCPACGTKFSHSNTQLACKRCGLPDEVRVLGPKAIMQWKRQQIKSTTNVLQRAVLETSLLRRGGASNKRKPKHGRTICADGSPDRNSRSDKSRYRKMRKAKLNATG